MSEQLGFYFQQDRCIGCFTCQVACKDKNNLEVGQRFRKVHEFAGGGFTATNKGFVNDVYAYWLSMSCNHCQEPSCVKNCPTGALQKRADDGVVFIDQQKCVGCRYCLMSCPYGAPQYNPKIGKTGKCDMCKDLLAKGEKPICVTSCPTRVLDFGNFGTAVLLYLTVAKGGSTRSLIGYIASLCGALTLISMSFIYTNTSYHAWSTVYTHLSFYGTAAVLGALTFSVIAATTKPDAGSMFYGKVLAIGATGAALQVFSLAPYLTSLAAGSAPMQATAKALYQSSPLLISGQILLAAGAFCFSFLAWKAYAKGGSKASQFIYIALLSVAAGELANRYLFYATGIHTMMGNF